MKARFALLLIGLGMLMLFLSACGGQEEAALPNLPYATVTAREGVNVRSGPGEEYAAVGTLAYREDTAIVGRSADSAWWVIPMQGSADNQGWITAAFVDAYNTENVPVIPAPSSVPPSAGGSVPTSSEITGIVWQWTSVRNRPTGETTEVANPEAYTIIFGDDGTVRGQADCNTFTGTYSTDGGFFINSTPDVMAACGGESLDIQYLELLDAIVTGGPDGSGGLALETAGSEQRMSFVNGGAAPGP